ncbi:8851_t:CDS:2 [Ambispora gerdemannii]|uniref:8851_t:CDS:1 n=1 Tax=Ambispora gerdemannii TaxID=144530 RepID=A0A9N8WL28_9GLOM|nr:8851_t:CDS:2 [Ambispora gerdemannii]
MAIKQLDIFRKNHKVNLGLSSSDIKQKVKHNVKEVEHFSNIEENSLQAYITQYNSCNSIGINITINNNFPDTTATLRTIINDKNGWRRFHILHLLPTMIPATSLIIHS